MAYLKEWFKVIKDGKLIGTATDQSFARYSGTSHRVHICTAAEGQYAIVKNNFYHDEWMFPVSKESYIDYQQASVVSIPKEEYDILQDQHVKPVERKMPENPGKDISQKVSEETKVTVEYVRECKLKDLSDICNKEIENGFSLVLSDGASHHFSMTAYDQLNLLDMELNLKNDDAVIYHADGELAQYYSQEDASAILTAARRWKNYNVALYNSFKNWINNLNDISEINAITFDSDIPEEYCSDILLMLTENI